MPKLSRCGHHTCTYLMKKKLQVVGTKMSHTLKTKAERQSSGRMTTKASVQCVQCVVTGRQRNTGENRE